MCLTCIHDGVLRQCKAGRLCQQPGHGHALGFELFSQDVQLVCDYCVADAELRHLQRACTRSSAVGIYMMLHTASLASFCSCRWNQAEMDTGLIGRLTRVPSMHAVPEGRAESHGSR